MKQVQISGSWLKNVESEMERLHVSGSQLADHMREGSLRDDGGGGSGDDAYDMNAQGETRQDRLVILQGV